MRTLQVVPEEPVNEGFVEGRDVIPQQRTVGLHAVLGDGPVEALDEGVHLGGAWIRVEMYEAERGAGVLEVFGELRSVVGLELFDGEWSDHHELLQEVCSRSGRVVRVRSREGELLLDIDCGEDVPLRAVYEADDTVELHATLVHAAQFLPLEHWLFVVCSGAGREGEFH